MSEYSYADAGLCGSSHYLLPVVAELLKDLPPNAIIADLGCGNGSFLGQLQGHGFELHGFEMSQSGLAEAVKAYPAIRFEYADLTVDLTSHELAGKCDVVISTEVVEHVFLPRLYAKNCHHFVKPGGLLIISTPYHGYLKNLVMALFAKLDAHFTALWDYGHIKFWSKRTLTLLLEEAGFEVLRFFGAGRVPYLWKSMILVARKS